MGNNNLLDAGTRREYCKRYFDAVGAPCLIDRPDYCEFELPVDVDKELTDRPYYWLWVERTGEPVKPTVLRLAFTEEAVQRETERLKAEAMASAEYAQMNDVQRMFFRPPTAELVAFGSFRLEKLFTSAKQRGQTACAAVVGQRDGQPWLCCQCLVTYQCDLSKQRVVSIGYSLVTGEIRTQFLDSIADLALQTASLNQCLAGFGSGASAALTGGFEAVQTYISEEISQESHEWAEEAMNRLQAELSGIDLYYDSLLKDLPEEEHSLVELERNRKKQEQEERMTPLIVCDITQAALIRC